MQITMTANGVELRGTLDSSPAGRDFASLLPLTVSLSDFHSTEKIGDLPRSLSTAGAADSTTPRAGTSG